MEAYMSVGFSLLLLIVMYAFGLYTIRNFRWVMLSLAWGAVGYGLSYLLYQKTIALDLNQAVMLILVLPIIQQIFVSLGVFAAMYWEQFDNLVDGSVYGFSGGLGYAIGKALESSLNHVETTFATASLTLATTLVLATASGIMGVVMTQFYFRHHAHRAVTLLSGLGAGIGYVVLFNYLVFEKVGGDILPIAFGVGGVTVIGLYITGQLRGAFIRLGVEKRRADSLLEIVIPIGVQLTYEKNFPKLLETMLVEAKSFCRADGGTFYLRKDDTLEFTVMRNDSLNIAMGGASGGGISIPPLHLHNSDGQPNHHNLATYVALTGRTVNIVDSYENEQFDFSGARAFDQQHNYASVSFLTMPLKNSSGEVIGVLQLLNPLDSSRKRLVPFDANLQQLMESFSSLAAAALEGYIQEQSLRKEIQQLRIEIDHAKREKQVTEITETSYFKGLQEKAQQMRGSKKEG